MRYDQAHCMSSHHFLHGGSQICLTTKHRYSSPTREKESQLHSQNPHMLQNDRLGPTAYLTVIFTFARTSGAALTSRP